MDIKQSAISFDVSNKLYKVDLGFYTAFFDSVILSQYGAIAFFGSNLLEGNDIKIDGNYIFGVSDFGQFQVCSILHTSSYERRILIGKRFFMTSCLIKGYGYYILYYVDEDNNWQFDSDLQGEEFTVSLSGDKITISNISLGIKIWSLNLSKIPTEDNNLLNSIVGDLSETHIKKTHILDFFYFDDLFHLYDEKVISCIETLRRSLPGIEIEVISFNKKAYPRFVIKVYIVSTRFDFSLLKKFLLMMGPHYFLVDSIGDAEILSQITEFMKIGNFQINIIDTNIQLPNNAIGYDQRFCDFQLSLHKLRYGLFSLEHQLSLVKNEQLAVSALGNPYVSLSQIRLDMTESDLGKHVILYEQTLQKFLELASHTII